MWPPRTLASRILLAVLGILLVTVALGAYLYVGLSARTLDQNYEQRAVGIAAAVAQEPAIVAAVAHGDPGGGTQALAQQITHATGAAYVVVTDRTGLRFSHPNPALIGRRLEEPVATLDGRNHVGIDAGSLGRSANGKAPVRAASGAVVGQVSVGILETQVTTEHRREVLLIGLYALVVFGLGVAASLLMARAIKRMTFGLELDQFAALLQEREAMLHGIREGVACFDRRGRLTVVNTEAEQLLHLSPGAVGKTIDELLPRGRLCDVLAGRIEGTDVEILTDDCLLVVNRRPVTLGGRRIGSVATLRDRTEVEALLRDLRAMSGLTSTLRAQEHEYANRLHAMSVLMELGELEEASDYLAELSAGALGRAEDLRSRISPSAVAALLTAKVSVAAERSITLTISPDSRLDQPRARTNDLLSVLGNLIDNALESLDGQPEPRLVTVEIADDDDVRITVRDSGPGIAATDPAVVFQDGWSTKTERDGLRRGVGLALVQRLVRRAGGTVEVRSDGGTCFEVRLPSAPVASSPPLAVR